MAKAISPDMVLAFGVTMQPPIMWLVWLKSNFTKPYRRPKILPAGVSLR